MSPPPTSLTHVLETCLYVKSMSDSKSFYQDTLGLTPSLQGERTTVFPLGSTTILLFQLGLTADDIHPEDHPEHTIPGHGPTQSLLTSLQSSDQQRLKQHFCLAVSSRQDVDKWEEYLKTQNVKILGVMEWEKGGRSVYFADPDGHVGEIGSRGIWDHY